MGSKYHKRSRIPLIKQAFRLVNDYPESHYTLRKGILIWYSEIRPLPLSRLYKIKIICEGYLHRPKVVLYGDKVDGIERDDFPHNFGKNLQKQEAILCLHMPYEFNYYDMWIADTIVLWTQEWLCHYEIWLATGEWCGGGHSSPVA